AEQVLRRGDLLDGALDGVPDPGVELLLVEVVLVVAGARDEQHLPGVQQHRVDGVQPVLLGELDDLPVPVLGFVLGLVDRVLVVLVRPERVQPRSLNPGQCEDHRRAYRKTTGTTAAGLVFHFLCPPRAICMVCSFPPCPVYVGRCPGVCAPAAPCGSTAASGG